jgi:hypothetical protein
MTRREGSFGLRQGERHIVTAEAASNLPTIGRVVTLNRRYDVRLIERTSLDGTDAYHLGLEPLVNPSRDRLRELWIDASTFAVLQARALGNFTDRPETTVPWLIRFSEIDGATYVSSEASEKPMPHRPITFDAVTIAFDRIAPRHGSRDLLFALEHDLDARDHVVEPSETAARGRPAHSC